MTRSHQIGCAKIKRANSACDECGVKYENMHNFCRNVTAHVMRVGLDDPVGIAVESEINAPLHL